MTQNPIDTTLYVTKIQVGDGLSVDPPSGTGIVTLNLAGAAEEIANTAITTVGDGLLTAAGIAGRLITRSGSTAAFTDTTATAVAIVAAIPGAFAAQSFYVTIKNLTAFPETIAGGVGVTITGNAILPAHSVGTYLLTVTSLTAISLFNTQIAPLTTVAPEVSTALSTVGDGTITAAGIAGGITARSGPTAVFTDTTATAALIIAARPNVAIGDSWEWTYQNATVYLATPVGGVGVTFSGLSVIPGLTVARFLVTYTAANTITIALLGFGYMVALPPVLQSTADWSAITTAQVAGLAGAQQCFISIRTTNLGGVSLPTPAQLYAATPNAVPGYSYGLTIRNDAQRTLSMGGLQSTHLSGFSTTQLSGISQTATVTFNTATDMTIFGMGKSGS